MTVEREALLKSENGLHVRVAAMLVQRAEELGAAGFIAKPFTAEMLYAALGSE